MSIQDEERPRVRLYVDRSDCWVGWYRGEESHYVCLLPCLVIRIDRKRPLQ